MLIASPKIIPNEKLRPNGEIKYPDKTNPRSVAIHDNLTTNFGPALSCILPLGTIKVANIKQAII